MLDLLRTHIYREVNDKAMASNWGKIQILTILLLLFAFSTGVGLYTDFLWFQSMGYESIFLTIIKYKILLAVIGAIIFSAFAITNVYIASKSYAISRTDEGDPEVILPENINTIVIGIIAAVALLFGLTISGYWELVLRYLMREPFGVVDPVFGRDVSFFIFELPLYENALKAGFFILAFTGVVTLLVYLLKSKSLLIDMTFSDVKFEIPKFTSWAKAHLFVLLALLFVLIGMNYQLQSFGFFGPGYTDFTAALPALKLLVALSLLTGLSMLLNIWVKRPWISLGMVLLLLAVHLLILGLYAGVIQEYRVRPNEISIETPYIENNIKFTKMAFGLEEVDSRIFDVGTNLTAEDIAQNALTIGNIRLWDPRPLKDTYSQIQEIRLYYEFNDVDVDRYTIDGDLVEIMLSAREIDPSGLPLSAQNWINDHLVYTHGYGVVASPVNMITSKGLPSLLIKDIPPVTEKFNITKPEIYYGEITDEYVIVNTGTEEFDYPSGDENQYTTYRAKSGVLLSSYIRKLAMSIRFATPKMILSNYITPQSRILFKRNIKEIVNTIAPFLAYDQDPYIVVSDGGLFWILDAYTTSTRYPYSTPHSKINYIRNPVKIIINAYTGETNFYVVDNTDPILLTYSGIFPGLFKPMSEMPSDMVAHIRYPEDMFTIQALVYSKYHMETPRVFYNLEDMWNIPDELYEGRKIKMVPYYIIMKIPGEEKEELILMQPFTPRNKNNMIAWMYARSDPEQYGKLGIFKFPKQELIFGPMQIEALIDQDSSISEQLTLWGQVGSKVIRGNLLVIPIDDTILYVEPLYLLADESKLPQLVRVIIAFGDRIVMEENLEKALLELFGASKEPSLPPIGEDLGDAEGLAAEALLHYNQALEALSAGDWNGFGEELAALEETLLQMKIRENT
jgi:uncharacterized membrane protein (UPF0182 family)